jgi:hypothetical protein
MPQISAEIRKGSCIRNSVYLQMSSVLNQLKNKIILNLLTSLCGILLNQKSRNSAKILLNSAYYTEYTELKKKHTEFRISGIPKTP